VPPPIEKGPHSCHHPLYATSELRQQANAWESSKGKNAQGLQQKKPLLELLLGGFGDRGAPDVPTSRVKKRPHRRRHFSFRKS
jgi:hypothetical protein